MRSSVGGWSENRFLNDTFIPASGLTMYMGRHLPADLRHRDLLGAGLQLGQGPGQRLAVADEAGAGAVGLVLPAAGQRQLQQRGRQRGQDDQGQHLEDVLALVVARPRRTGRPRRPSGPAR